MTDFGRRNLLSTATRSVLAGADRIELLSLDPMVPTSRDPGRFWGWHVLGSTVVEQPTTRDDLVAALELGIAENEGWVKACFDPRHGIRATRGGETVELLVCFECAQVWVYTGGRRTESVLVTPSPEPVFDRLLRVAGIPLAEKRS